MCVKSLWVAGLLVLGACAANAQSYWSANSSLNCGAYYGTDSKGTPLQLGSDAGAGAGGYVCFVYGTLPWYASGAGWGSSIRVSAPPSAPVAFFFDFSDVNGADATLDFTYEGDTTVYNGTSASQALYANQPLELDILGLHSQAPKYGTTANGPVVVLAECPDANTCSQVQAQLIYSALPSQPWSLSAPVIFDWQTSFVWSAVGVDDSATNTNTSTKNTVSFVIYNVDTVGLASHTYKINVYDSTGKLAGTGTTKSVPLYGSYADLLTSVVPKLPAGSFKVQVVGTTYLAFEALQFHGPSATTLVAAPEIVGTAAPATGSSVGGRNRHPSPSALRLALPHIAQ
jgi:hypothetical protein